LYKGEEREVGIYFCRGGGRRPAQTSSSVGEREGGDGKTLLQKRERERRFSTSLESRGRE